MTEHDIGKMITCTIDSMPVPWEKLWTVFRKILQLTQRENENNIIPKEENSEVETTGEEYRGGHKCQKEDLEYMEGSTFQRH